MISIGLLGRSRVISFAVLKFATITMPTTRKKAKLEQNSPEKPVARSTKVAAKKVANTEPEQVRDPEPKRKDASQNVANTKAVPSTSNKVPVTKSETSTSEKAPVTKSNKSTSKKATIASSETSKQYSTKNAPSTASIFIKLFEEERQKTADSILRFKFNKSRARILNDLSVVKSGSNGIVYWMFRDQRVQDNWAFLFAQKLALKNKVPLHVCFCLLPKFLDANTRHYKFLVKGLQEVESECNQLNISFHLLYGNGGTEVPKFVQKYSMGAIVCDFCPLRVPMQWIDTLKKDTPSDIPIIQVDSHNIVPVWITSDKQEYAARTIRNKIVSKLEDFLTQFPPVIQHPYDRTAEKIPKNDWINCWKHVDIDELPEVEWAVPGYSGGIGQLEEFCTSRLKYYSTKKNDPTQNVLSDLAPWFHFGQISPQRCVLQVSKFKSLYKESVDVFLEESIVRRELSDNFCFYNEHYDSLKGAASWARQTLEQHSTDKREWIYSVEQLAQAKTHDDLWNSAQLQLRKEGKMHGFLRMYWAKKILEWSETPEEALSASIYLNDYYSLDGRDPNGYVGCMWSIAGIHDQGWGERPIFGKIRFMNYNGCKRKFDINAYIARYGGKVY